MALPSAFFTMRATWVQWVTWARWWTGSILPRRSWYPHQHSHLNPPSPQPLPSHYGHPLPYVPAQHQEHFSHQPLNPSRITNIKNASIEMNQKTFHLTYLGCAKNDVDSDSMVQLLERNGYRAVTEPQRASVLIVNTCGFIGSAREQSYRELRTLAERKRPDQVLIAAGCLTQRYGAEVARQVPGVDGILGTRRWMDIIEVVRTLRKGMASPSGSGLRPEPVYHLPETATIGTDENGALRASIAGGSAYLKISDGCRRPCAFCAIPLIKGPTVSRPIATVIAEAQRLRDSGVRELILIAQDTTDYGHDLG